MIINLLLGLLTAVIILCLFSIIEKRRVPSIGNIKYVWVILVFVAAQLVNVNENLKEWFIWALFLYTVLDDIKTRTIFTPMYFLIIGTLFFYGYSFKEFIFAFVVFMVFILISKKSEETFFKTGDAYAIFAIAFFLGKEVFVSLIVSLFLASAILPFVGILYKAKYYAFVPFLVVGAIIVKENWFVVEVLFISFVINICWIILSRFFKGKQKK